MNSIEEWIKWIPTEKITSKYFIEYNTDGMEGFKIVFTSILNKKNPLILLFENSVSSYRNTDEAFRLNTIEYLDSKYGGDFYSKWTFFKVLNSKYINWLSEQSYKTTDDLSRIHFSFIDDNFILDVIASYEPKVEFL